ncbi:hypothetical protein Sru01_67840 [Sphaerisporangium rufum]|uniref:Uncharacterized protein n=1 Tax=Sphaerisporangium rufum TaxID=1381558 RepID=A0A919RD14_9ACTN|nr:hypothetical protein [Sphaerisporangium rufum]GII81802.1 hypothetical protein Sru01_67840 [Sphaerisporangium rufum]
MSEHVGLVDLPPGQVRDVVLQVGTGTLREEDVPLVVGAVPGRTVMVTGGPARFTARVSGVPLTIEVDRASGWVQARGQWWWCGRLQVEEHPEGALIRRRTYNLATGPIARAVPLTVGRGHRESGREALIGVLDTFERRFGARTRLLPAGEGR